MLQSLPLSCCHAANPVYVPKHAPAHTGSCMHCYLMHPFVELLAVTQAELVSVDGDRVKKFDVKAEADASALGKRISEATLQVWQHFKQNSGNPT